MSRRYSFSSPVIVDQLISLLKVQVGALSKFVHSTANVAGLGQLRQTTDALIRTVADLDESSSKTADLHPFENAVEQVSDAYQQVRMALVNTWGNNCLITFNH